MGFFKQLKVRAQVLLGFSAVVVMLVAVGGFCLSQLHAENMRGDDLRNFRLPAVRDSLQMQSNLRDMRIGEFRLAGARTPDEVRTAIEQLDASMANYRQTMASFMKLRFDKEVGAALEDIESLRPRYVAADKTVREMAQAGKGSEALTVLLSTDDVFKAGERDFQTIVDANMNAAVRDGERARSAYNGALTLTIGFILVAVAAALGLAWAIARNMVGQLGGEPSDAAHIASEIAAGNLRVQSTLKRNDESSLMYSLESMKNQLTTIVHGIKDASDSISVAAREIAQGNADLSQRTEQQAASLGETATSMEQLTGAVRQNASNASQGATLAGTASAVAQRGGEVVQRVVGTMQDICVSSGKVAEIVNVIEGIAFQTNILALNAAVESARAGEQGRGFAVVAGEVRALAQRSAASAREVKALIESSVSQVEAGEKLVAEAGVTIAEIVESVHRVSLIMSEIATASDEQSVGIEQVNRAIAQMDVVTQQNAALVEEAAAAAQSMSHQAQSLRDDVSIFRVGKQA